MRKISVAVAAVMVAVLVINVAGAADYQSCDPFAKESEFRIVQVKGNRVKLAPCDSFQREYHWKFGDGSQYSTFFDEAVVHRYQRSRIYPISLRTEDMFGEKSVTTHQVPIGVPARPEVSVKIRGKLPPEAAVLFISFLFFLLGSGG